MAILGIQSQIIHNLATIALLVVGVALVVVAVCIVRKKRDG